MLHIANIYKKYNYALENIAYLLCENVLCDTYVLDSRAVYYLVD